MTAAPATQSFGSEVVSFFKNLPTEVTTLKSTVASWFAKVDVSVDKAAPVVEEATSFVAGFVPGAAVALTAEQSFVAGMDALEALSQKISGGVSNPADAVNAFQSTWTTLKSDWAAIKAAV